MQIRTEADAFACLAVLVAGADGVGTMEEGAFLYDAVAQLPVFDGLDRAQFATLLSDVCSRVYDSGHTPTGRVSEDQVSSLLTQIRDTLSPERRAEAFRMAEDLARSDAMSGEEQILITRLRVELLAEA